MIVTQELREVMQQDQQTPQCSLVQSFLLENQFSVPEEGIEELEQVDKELLVEWPALSRLSFVLRRQHLVEELSLGDELQPGVCETGQIARL